MLRESLREIEKIREITTHPGTKCHNGGEYGFSTIYIRHWPDTWRIEYASSMEFDYCFICGDFHDPEECPDGTLEVITTGELLDRLDGARVVEKEGSILVVDTTGHEEPFNYGGGCYVCWPSCRDGRL